MINVGTHTKPYNDEEFLDLETSLRTIIEDILTDPTFESRAFFTVVQNPNNRRLIQQTEPWGRTGDRLSITRRKHVFAIEKGTVTGRVDAHIIIDLKHRDSKLQVDYKAIGEMIDEKLVEQNQIWRTQGYPLSRNPLKINQALQWANPKVYVSFSQLGYNNLTGADLYIRKQVGSRQRVFETEENVINKMSISFITNENSTITYHPPG